MGSRDEDHQTASHHQPLLSSLVVRPSNSDGGVGGRAGDYEPGEVRREPHPYSRSDRFSDDHAPSVACKNLHLEEGYRMHAGSSSPVRRRDADRYISDYDHSGGLPRNRELNNGRDPGRYRDISPSYPRVRGRGRPFDRGIDRPDFGPGPIRGEGVGRSNPNVRPREGDWFCPDPLCGNLNFARREYCNKCNRSRHGPVGSPRRGYPGPPHPHALPRRIPGPTMDRSPGRTMNGYRCPPRGWVRDGPRDFGSGGLPPPRHDSRLPDQHLRRDRLDYPDDGYRGRAKFDRPIPMDWGHRDRGRENLLSERRTFERRPLSPPAPLPPPPNRGRWARDARERSRSPIRGAPSPKDYRRDVYMDRGRDDGRGLGRGRVGGAY